VWCPLVQEDGDSLDSLFAECEDALAISRQVFRPRDATPR
jgi:hypothetical protein